jgi:hypothetical protein
MSRKTKINYIKMEKFSDLVKDSLSIENLSKIKGGGECSDGCQTGKCSQQNNTSYCDGGAVCTIGIAGIVLPVNPPKIVASSVKIL